MKRLALYVGVMAVCTLVCVVVMLIVPHGVNWGTAVLIVDLAISCVVAWRWRHVWTGQQEAN